MKLPLFHKTLPVDECHRVHMEQNNAMEALAKYLDRILARSLLPGQPLVLLCIGTDRSTGDSLGPLVGTRLSSHNHPQVKVFGTLDRPVHAVNLEETLATIKKDLGNAFILSIDACLGRTESIGYISIKSGPLQPGTGVNKSLSEVGDAHIIGIVNVGGFMEYLVLQNTRLSIVMKMADIISDAICLVLNKIFPAYPNTHASAAYDLLPLRD